MKGTALLLSELPARWGRLRPKISFAREIVNREPVLNFGEPTRRGQRGLPKTSYSYLTRNGTKSRPRPSISAKAVLRSRGEEEMDLRRLRKGLAAVALAAVAIGA